MDFQIAFRQTRERPLDRTVHLSAGVVRARPDEIEPERIMDFAVGIQNGSIQALHQLQHCYPGRNEWTDHLQHKGMDLGNILTQKIFPVPDIGDHLLIHPRLTRIDPCLDGAQVFAFSGLLISDRVKIDCNHLYAFSGMPASPAPSREVPPIIEATHGNGLAAFFRMPIWGFGDEPVGVPSTMHLDICDSLDIYRRYQIIGPHTDAERAEFAELEALLQPLGLATRNNPQFLKTITKLFTDRPDLMRPSSAPQNRAWMDDMQSAMAQAVRAVIAEDDLITPMP